MRGSILFFTTIFIISISISSGQPVTGTNGLGQYGAGAAIVQDYQCIGINPANLGYFNTNTKLISFGVAEFSFTLHSDALTRSEIMDSLLHGRNLSPEGRNHAAETFTNQGISLATSFSPVSFAVQLPKLGGFAFSWKENFLASVKLNSFFAHLLFQGYNLPYFDSIITVNGILTGILTHPDSAVSIAKLFDGSHISMDWYREYNFSYGREIKEWNSFKLYGGIGFKIIKGYGIAFADFENGEANGFSATSPVFNIKYPQVNNPSAQGGSGLKPVGHGTGFDIGASLGWKEKYYFATSVTDIGSVTWDGNAYTLKNIKLDSLSGFSGIGSYDILEMIKQVSGSNQLLQYNGVKSVKIKLPEKFRFGASAILSKKFDAAVDFIEPMNKEPGNLPKTMFAGMIGFKPVKFIKLSTGFVTGGLTNFDIPLGLAISAGPYRFGISTGDIISWFSQSKPTLSLSVGLLRFQF